MNPKFTIVTITYNSSKYVSQTIESVLNQSFTNFEYIILDDHSTDETWQIIERYEDYRLTKEKNKQNIGEYQNRNRALEKAKGDFILYVDGDDILFKNTLRNISEYIDYFPNTGMIWGVPFEYFDFVVLPYLFEPEKLIQLIYYTQIPLANIGFTETIFRTSLLKKNNGFSVKYRIGDVYIKKKLALTTKTLFIPMGLMFWRRSENQSSKTASNSNIGFLEGFKIDMEIIENKYFPLNHNDKINLKIAIRTSMLRRLILRYLPKLKFKEFIYLFRYFRFSIIDFRFILKKYKFIKTLDRMDEPLLNNFHLTKEYEKN